MQWQKVINYSENVVITVIVNFISFIRFRTAICIQSDNEKVIPPTNCLPSKKPKIEFEHCNSHCEIE